MSTSKATKAAKEMGRDFWGAHYVAPMASAMHTDGYALKRWLRGTGPADLQARLVKLADAMLVRHLHLAIIAAEWCDRIRQQSKVVDASIVARLKGIKRDLAPTPPAPVEPPRVYIYEERYDNDPNRSIDDLVKGDHPMVAQCFREAMESNE
jgi:hypothetical protein